MTSKDGCELYTKRGELKHRIGYFKISFVSRYGNQIGAYDDTNCTKGESVYPIAYSGIDALINKDMRKERQISITNVLRTGSAGNTVRAKIVNWIEAFVQRNDLGNRSFVGDVAGGWSSSPWNPKLKAHFENSKIIVTCNPWKWEGDFRLWEALMAGALVMVDNMAVPGFMPHPFKHREHLVFYDSNNQTEFEELLDYYVKHEDEARQIGEAGYRYVLDHHMPKDRVSYVIDKIESKFVSKIDYKRTQEAVKRLASNVSCELERSMDPPAKSIIIDFEKINHISNSQLERVQGYTTKQYAEYLLKPAGSEHYAFLNYMSATYGDCRHLVDIGTYAATSALALGSNQRSPVRTFDLPTSNSNKKLQEEVRAVGVDIQFHNLDLLKISDGEFKKYMLTWFIMMDTNVVSFERQFFQRLLKISFKGMLVLDDIHIGEMKPWWEKLEKRAAKNNYTTHDLTKVGHASGTGLVDFSGKVTIKQRL